MSDLQFTWGVTTPATEKPITVAQAKTHLRVDGSEEDTYINDLIDVCTDHVEEEQHRQLLPATLELNVSRFPHSTAKRIYLPKPPLISVGSITYLDSDGAEQTWDSSKYDVVVESLYGYIVPAYGESYPSVREGTDAITITYNAGYADAGSVPASTRHAIKLLLANFFEQREPVIVGTTQASLSLSYQSCVKKHWVPIYSFWQRY